METTILSEINFSKSIILLQEKLISWFESTILFLPDFLVALSVFIVFYFAARSASKLAKKFLVKYLKNYALGSFLSTVIKITILLLGFIVAINIMHLDKAVTSLLAGVGIAGVALGFAFQDITANLLSGVALVINKDYPFKVKDIIETNNFIGYVEEISLRSTTISTFQGQTVIIPNRVIYENPLVNYSFTKKRRVDLEIGVSYGDDLKKVVDIIMKAIQNIDRDKSKEIEVFYKEYGSSSINLELRFWVPFQNPNQYLEARHQAIIAVKAAFDANDITIPFPIRTLDFGIKGGKTLETMLGK